MPKEQVGHTLHVLNSTIRRFIDNYSHKQECDQLTGANMWVLLFISQNEGHPVYLRDVERHFGITRSTASKVVDLLVRKGYVERHTGETDARLRRLTLTPAAEALLETIRQDQEMMENELLQGFTANEIATALSYLHRMKSNIDNAVLRRQKTEKEELS